MSGTHYDVIIIGTGAGGGTLAYHLAPSGKRILILERGDYVPREKSNWDPKTVNVDAHYNTRETWLDKDGEELHPHTNYNVGGNTKFYGAALFRMRKEDFGELRHHGGVSPAWPISYDDLEPYYTQAEQLYQVHGQRGEDPTEPEAGGPYPFPAVSHEPRIQHLADDFARSGLKPFHVPLASVFMIFELTQDYQILVPLMVANLLSFMISKHYQPKPIYHALLEQDRIFLPGPESRLRAGSARVTDVMTRDILLVPPQMSIENVWDQVREDGNRPLFVGSTDSLVGILTRSDVEKAIRACKGGEALTSLQMKTDGYHVYPDQPLDLALGRLAQTSGVMPVLSRQGHKVIGAVTKETLMRFVDQNSAEQD